MTTVENPTKYQKYLGFYDGNPVNLAPLAETERASKLIGMKGIL